MTITLSPLAQKLVEEQMSTGRFVSPDDVVQTAIETLSRLDQQSYEELDAESRAAIEDAEAQYQRGEGLPWDQVREELRARFIDRK